MKIKLLLMMMLIASYTFATRTSVTPTTLATALTSANSGDTLLLAGGAYSAAITLQSGKLLTLKSEGTGSVVFSGTVGGTATDTGCGFIFDGITINRNNSYVVDGSTFGNIDLIAFRNDTIINVNRCLIRGGNTTATNLTSIEITNCIVSNCGLSGYCFLYPKFNVNNVTIRNNTFIRYSGGESLFRPQVTNTSNVLNFIFENNTVFKWSKGSSYAICYSAATQSTSSNFSIRNNIFAEPGVAGQKPKLLVATGGNITEKNNLSVNYGRFTLTTPTSVDTMLTQMTYNLYDPAIGFQDTTLTNTTLNAGGTLIPFGDFHILSTSPLATASTSAGIIGDPRWLKLKNVTTNYSPEAQALVKAYRVNSGLVLREVPVGAMIRVYAINGGLILTQKAGSSTVNVAVKVPCLIRVKSNELTSTLKVL